MHKKHSLHALNIKITIVVDFGIEMYGRFRNRGSFADGFLIR
jgi:hypothetical protein